VQIYCTQCNQPHTLEPPYVLRCPHCQSPAHRLLHGREIQIESIEIEESPEVEDATAYP
jgi:Zn finger protein HypA/HybF involved in hydrogenase expression